MRTTVLIGAMFVIDALQFQAGRHTFFLEWHWTRRAALYAGLVVVILVFGGLDADVPFIYFQF
jgi:hypothetical protein